MKQFIKVMKALSEPNRVKILKALLKREMCVCEIQALIGLAQPTVSKHLKVLEEADLITYSKENLWVNYRVYKETPNPYAKILIQFLEEWLEDDPAIKEVIFRIDTVDRYQICSPAFKKQVKKEETSWM
ncbi:MAG: metalloregulator ArsR/SmtB family transcription factor [Thermodesulforhabdaceae bacterium]